MPSMRRSKQELPYDECVTILDEGSWGVLSVHGDNGYPYGVPMNYVLLDDQEGSLSICMHSALTGHKMNAIKDDSRASFTVVGQSLIVPEEITDYYRSTIAFGTVRVENYPVLREQMLVALGNKYCTGLEELVHDDIRKSGPRCAVLVMDVEHLSGKEAKALAKMRMHGE